MADDRSLSDWEAVGDDATSPNATATSNAGGGGDQSNEPDTVVVELPPGGIAIRQTQPDGLERQPRKHQDGSSTSSFSMVQRIDNLDLGHVSIGESYTAMPSASAATPPSSYAYSGRSTSIASVSSNASLSSEFDILSISGETIKRCRSCKFSNHTNSTICLGCGLALVANPNISMDEQIAVHLQRKEEEDALALLQQEEHKRKRFFEDPLYSIALVLGKDVQETVNKPHGYGEVHTFGDIGYHAMAQEPFSLLATKFMNASKGLPYAKVSFAYKVSSRKMLERISEEGFAPSIPCPFGGAEAVGDVRIFNTIEAAVEAFRQDGEPLSRGYDPLFPILENSTERDVGNCLGWIVAIAESSPPSVELQGRWTSNNVICRFNTAPSPELVLPLVYFAPESVDSDKSRLLLEDLQGIFTELFVCGLRMKVGSLPPSPKKAKSLEPAESDDTDPTTAKRAPEVVIAKQGKSFGPPKVQLVEKTDSTHVIQTAACIWAVAVSPRSGALAFGGDDTKIHLWSEELGQYANLEGHTKYINALAFAPPASSPSSSAHNGEDIERLASGDQSGAVRVWDTTPGTNQALLMELGEGVRHPIIDIRFFPSGKTLAVVDRNRECRLWKLSDGTCTCRLKGHRPERRLGEYFSLQAATFSPDGQSLASTADVSPYIYFWKFNGDKKLLHGHTYSMDTIGRREIQIRALAFSPDGSRLASAANDRTIRLWEPSAPGGWPTSRSDDDALVRDLPKPVSCLAFSPDGRRIAGGDGDGSVWLWDTESGNEVATFSGHKGSVKSIAFFKDGKTIVSSGPDCTIRFWAIN